MAKEGPHKMTRLRVLKTGTGIAVGSILGQRLRAMLSEASDRT
jgi:hypothetical protein